MSSTLKNCGNWTIVLNPSGTTAGNLIPLLQRIQEMLAYLPPEAIHRVARHLHLTAGEVYGVATFYNQFRFHPPGKHPIKVVWEQPAT